MLRERWQAHIEASLTRPVLLVDETQELQAATLTELRLLASKNLDSSPLLTIVLCGDSRLLDKLKMPDLIPVAAASGAGSSSTRCRATSGSPACTTHSQRRATRS